jgi:transcriptional antiterminator
MKTIAQLAKELGVSKTAVRNKIANLGLQTSLQKNGNQFAIDSEKESLIINAFNQNSQTKNENQTQTETETVSDSVSVLISILQTELDVKNKQIDDLNARLAEMTAALRASQETANLEQALHAGTIKKQLLAAPDPEGKPGFFARFKIFSVKR